MNEDPQSYVTEINGCISTAAKRLFFLLNKRKKNKKISIFFNLL